MPKPLVGEPVAGRSIRMMNSRCDRCGVYAPELLPFKLSETITYRRRLISRPWLCPKCFKIEKEKWWKNRV